MIFIIFIILSLSFIRNSVISTPHSHFTSRTMKKLIFVINDHAKVGKSSLSAALHGYLKDQNFKSHFVGIVGNEELDTTGANYDETWNIIDDNNIDTMFGWLEKYEAVVCDVETGDSAALFDLYESEDLDVVLGELDVELTIVTPDVEEAECHQELLEIADFFSDNADYIVARIPLDEFSSSLEAWEDSEACKVMDYMGAYVIEIPRLTDPVHDMLDHYEIAFPEALSMDQDDMEEELANAINKWSLKFEHEIAESADFLHPETPGGRKGFKIAVGE